MESKTVFGHLALRFAVHPENLATEALSFILRTSRSASRAFTALVRELGVDDPGTLHFDSQQGGLERSIPDMKCTDDQGRLRVVVENKFWAGLTENQPETYIRELPATVAALVLFVVPESRRTFVWNEVVSRCNGAGILVNEVGSSGIAKVADIGAGRRLAATSWSALLGVLSAAAASAGETGTLNDIVQLQGLCESMDSEAFLPFRSDELTNLEMARRYVNLAELPFDIAESASRLGLCDKKRGSSDSYSSGTWVKIGAFTAWFGFAANLWLKFGVSPIWVIFYMEQGQLNEVRGKLRRFGIATPQRCFAATGAGYKFVAVPIFLVAGVEKPGFVRDAVRQIGELRAELGAQNDPGNVVNSAHSDESAGSLDLSPKVERGPWTGEIILEIGAEGGTISLFGDKDAQGKWRFWTRTNETTVSDLLDDDELGGLGSLANTSEPVSTFREAIALLDKYPWHRLQPLHIHHEFGPAILREVEKRGTSEQVDRWNSYDRLT